MHEIQDIKIDPRSKKLKDFIPLVISFFLGLVVLSVYQNTSLYFSGVLDSIVNKSFFILLLHHLGFASVCALFLAFLFNILENWRPGKGFLTVKIIIGILLLVEVVLVNYYVRNYEVLGANFSGWSSLSGTRNSFFQVIGILTLCILVTHYSYKYITSFYRLISRMYPFTIILFSLFLATLYSEKKAVNENKTQHLLERIGKNLFDTNVYEGDAEYPLLKETDYTTDLHKYFHLKSDRPSIKIIVVNGLGSSFVNEGGAYINFMPYLSSLKTESLYWNNFLSNTGEDHGALPSIVGSLPFGQNGFTHINELVHRNTLYSILQKNGYLTSFAYGGNSALNAYDKFLYEEGVEQILDKNAFGKEYTMQTEDAAGISLGYPDKQLFKKYHSNMSSDTIPSLDVLVTLSTKEPYQIPMMEHYLEKVGLSLSNSRFGGRTKRIINKNAALFASFLYTDEAIEEFMAAEQNLSSYDNTIYIITGSHHATDLPQENTLSRYRVPLIIYSPLLKSEQVFNEVASHADIVPTLLSLLDKQYGIDAPKDVAWLGSGLQAQKNLFNKKQIPLLRSTNNIQDYIDGSHFLTDGDVYELDQDLKFLEAEEDSEIEAIKKSFDQFKAINAYVTTEDKILPKDISLITYTENTFTKEQEIWIQSVFNGQNFDEAYGTARRLALDNDWSRSLLLCKYILSEIPRHADTEILMGRLYAWQENYEKSISILEKVVQKYPDYEDGYCALLDAYYWADKDENVFWIKESVAKHKLTQDLLTEKIERSLQKVQEKRTQELQEAVKEDKGAVVKNNTK
ncbi:sulfatase-like hydrolase/transferase [Maribacter aestuarii]|uniref:sulfatase-like hydrolase/transferase n=1 Tax=Maribacter aestuarii TaxID=1130723 RepID=UPI00248D2BEA|nr:sulfatase-like hydrolase/transferase [Maribacter aestuarii]